MKLKVDSIKQLHTKACDGLDKMKNYTLNSIHVCSALLCGSGQVYVGANVQWWAGNCAEQTVMGMAIANGETEFCAVISVQDCDGRAKVVPSCGRCLQMFALHAPNIMIVLQEGKSLTTKTLSEMLPFAYKD